MRKSIDINLIPPQVVEIEGAWVARELGLDVAEFRALMDEGKIAVLCERGKDEDAGLYRASFYHRGRRARFVVNADGEPVPHPDGASPPQGQSKPSVKILSSTAMPRRSKA